LNQLELPDFALLFCAIAAAVLFKEVDIKGERGCSHANDTVWRAICVRFALNCFYWVCWLSIKAHLLTVSRKVDLCVCS
jgi:hypothetical protein